MATKSEHAQPALDSGKEVNFFLVQTLAKVDSARKVTLLPWTTFVLVNGVLQLHAFKVLLRRNFHFFFQAEDGIRDVERSRGLGDVYKRQGQKLSRARGSPS